MHRGFFITFSWLCFCLAGLGYPQAGAFAMPTSTDGRSSPAKISAWPLLGRFDAQFIVIPEGVLPGGRKVASFEASRYPVTREIWNSLMPDFLVEVKDCPSCPVTDVLWEKENGEEAEIPLFLKRLNEAVSDSQCVYDLPTNEQLWYMLRSDVTGQRRCLYSQKWHPTDNCMVEIQAEEVDQFVTHAGNSKGRAQPVGSKRHNAFGIELGNVWRLSKDPARVAGRYVGRIARGGSWFFDLACAHTNYATVAFMGDRQDFIGFSLVRKCTKTEKSGE